VASSTKKGAPQSAAERYRKLPPPPQGEPDPLTLYDYEEAGSFLRMTWRQVKDRVDSGVIGHVRHGRRRLILGRQITKYIEDHKYPPVSRRHRAGGAR
jgi:hypothetical protein